MRAERETYPMTLTLTISETALADSIRSAEMTRGSGFSATFGQITLEGQVRPLYDANEPPGYRLTISQQDPRVASWGQDFTVMGWEITPNAGGTYPGSTSVKLRAELPSDPRLVSDIQEHALTLVESDITALTFLSGDYKTAFDNTPNTTALPRWRWVKQRLMAAVSQARTMADMVRLLAQEGVEPRFTDAGAFNHLAVLGTPQRRTTGQLWLTVPASELHLESPIISVPDPWNDADNYVTRKISAPSHTLTNRSASLTTVGSKEPELLLSGESVLSSVANWRIRMAKIGLAADTTRLSFRSHDPDLRLSPGVLITDLDLALDSTLSDYDDQDWLIDSATITIPESGAPHMAVSARLYHGDDAPSG